jgi:hypothetical protein
VQADLALTRVFANEFLDYFAQSRPLQAEALSTVIQAPGHYRRLWIENGMLDFLCTSQESPAVLPARALAGACLPLLRNLAEAASYEIACPNMPERLSDQERRTILLKEVFINPFSYRRLLGLSLLGLMREQVAAVHVPRSSAYTDSGFMARTMYWFGLYTAHAPEIPEIVYKQAGGLLQLWERGLDRW